MAHTRRGDGETQSDDGAEVKGCVRGGGVEMGYSPSTVEFDSCVLRFGCSACAS